MKKLVLPKILTRTGIYLLTFEKRVPAPDKNTQLSPRKALFLVLAQQSTGFASYVDYANCLLLSSLLFVLLCFYEFSLRFLTKFVKTENEQKSLTSSDVSGESSCNGIFKKQVTDVHTDTHVALLAFLSYPS